MKKPVIESKDISPELYEELAAAEALAVDCEMMGLDHRRDRLCVVQVASETGSCVLVQIKEEEKSPKLQALMEDPKILKIFHYARMDILFLYTRLGIEVQNIFCTKIASRLARTYTDRHGLQELVREFLGEKMDKSAQSSDWGKEQLHKDQIHYAACDVLYLFKVRTCLETMLIREKRKDLYDKLLAFLPTQRELDYLGFKDIFEHKVRNC